MAEVEAQNAALVALLGLLPVVGYAVWSTELSPYLAVVNTVIISVAFYLMLSPSDSEVTSAA